MRADDLSAHALAQSHLARIPATDAVVQAWAHLDPLRALARAERCDAVAPDRRGPLHGIGVGREGHHRDHQHAHRDGLADLRRASSAVRCRMRRASVSRRWLRARQDGDHRVRLFPSRQDGESVESAAHAGRLVVGVGGRGRGGTGPRRDRHADQWLGDPAGGILRCRRIQADERHDPAGRRARLQRDARSDRHVRARCRGRGAPRKRARGSGAHCRGGAAACASAARCLRCPLSVDDDRPQRCGNAGRCRRTPHRAAARTSKASNCRPAGTTPISCTARS